MKKINNVTNPLLGLEDITFPCDMEVWDKQSDKKVKRKVIMTFEHNGGTKYVEFDEAINEYFVYKYAQPIQSLTISELLQIASEVKGCKVILKEDK
jgi:predicted nuclease of restriction endonuclease-like RecB superfamily